MVPDEKTHRLEPLRLMRTIQERCTRSEFAFLYMRYTVVHSRRSAPSRSRDAIFWIQWDDRVDDSIAHEVATRFCREVCENPVLDVEHAAEALNVTAVESSKEVPSEK
jgi:hypothetical protein